MQPNVRSQADELVGLLPLKSGARLLDIACGKAELLLRIAQRHDASGIGVDISPYEVEEANRRVASRQMADRIEIVNIDGAGYAARPGSFDMAMCIGATWVWNGFAGTIEALKKIVAPGGLIAIGEPFKLKDLDPGYIAAEPEFAPTLVTHAELGDLPVQNALTGNGCSVCRSHERNLSAFLQPSPARRTSAPGFDHWYVDVHHGFRYRHQCFFISKGSQINLTLPEVLNGLETVGVR